MTTLLRTYLGLYGYVFKMTGRALARRWTYLFVAPVAAIAYEVIIQAVSRMVSGIGGGLAAGLVVGVLQAMLFSLLVFVGRAIIEQRYLSFDDLIGGFMVFYGDIIWVQIVLWLAMMLLGEVTPWAGMLQIAAFGLFPFFETIGLTSVGGLSVYEAVWRFVRRDAPAWFLGNAPLLALFPLADLIGNTIEQLVYQVPLPAAGFVGSIAKAAVFYLLLFAAYIYRGILFLTLDNTSARARAERFGGVPGFR